MATTSPPGPPSPQGTPGREGGSDAPLPRAQPEGASVPAGLFALFATMATAALAVSVVALIVAGAHDDGTAATSTGPVKTVDVELVSFDVKPDRVEVPPGTDLIVNVTNNADIQHDLMLDGKTGTHRLQPGESQTVDFGVIDGDAEAWCTVPGHKAAGMVLTIAATPGQPPDAPNAGSH
jgi:nitrite reductase (NO-forming)